ncbi:unnamed protein product [Prorocentrum cordatum]|uniref:Uncharacterized protein n=1 Tax=Prorocentrum cordatum TaxID=2364126 RepID=A0ABN9RTR0_9DINO|nr:unnamed protein product [Polarella glacialis]
MPPCRRGLPRGGPSLRAEAARSDGHRRTLSAVDDDDDDDQPRSFCGVLAHARLAGIGARAEIWSLGGRRIEAPSGRFCWGFAKAEGGGVGHCPAGLVQPRTR